MYTPHILSHLDPVLALTSNFLKLHLNITIPPMPGFSKRSFSLRFPYQILVYVSPSPTPTSCPSHLIHLVLITRKILREEHRSFSSSSCSLFHSLVTSFLLGPNNLLIRLFSNTFCRLTHANKTVVESICNFV